MSRFFAFGCSFTSYLWPTWADIVGREFDVFQNWGQSGASNHYIFNAFVESNLKNKFTKDDTIAIMWTNVARYGQYKNGQWITPGNVFTSQDTDDYDVRGFYIRDLAYIDSVKRILDSIGCRYYFMSMVPITKFGQYDDCVNSDMDEISDFIEFYDEALHSIKPSIYEVVFNSDWYSRPFKENFNFESFKHAYDLVAGESWPSARDFLNNKFDGISDQIIKEISNERRWKWNLHKNTRSDTHATPIEHLEYIGKVLPELNISKDTVRWCSNVDYLLRNSKSYSDLWEPNTAQRW